MFITGKDTAELRIPFDFRQKNPDDLTPDRQDFRKTGLPAGPCSVTVRQAPGLPASALLSAVLSVLKH